MSICTSAEATKKLAQSLLAECGLLEPPLNLDVLYDKLKLERYSRLFQNDCVWQNYKLPKDIRAILDVNEKLVIINCGAHEKQQFFASAHEVGHFVIPWQRELLYFCSIWDLKEKTRKLFEQEANIFAAEILFYSDLFTLESRDLSFGMQSIIELAERYNVSLEAAARRYVERSHIPCALMVCDPINNSVIDLLAPPSTKLLYYHRSDSFNIDFKIPQIFPPEHVISRACSKLGDICCGELTVSGTTLYRESIFTKYKVLSLVSIK